MTKNLRLEFSDDGFATIHMVNGENRFRLDTVLEWNQMLDAVIENKDTKALLITGEGRFFSNGIDLEWVSQQKDDIPRRYINMLHELLRRVLVLPIPTAALINGHAFGAGAFLALVCDFRVMRPDKGFLNWPETPLGMRFGEALIQILRVKIPPGVVQRDALIFAKRLTGDHAKRLGLVDEVVQQEMLEDSARKLIKEVLGRKGLGRDIIHTMKKDVYGNVIDFSKL